MASHLVDQHQQSSFASPVDGQAGSAAVVLGNDNATVTSYNAHDADATIHLQSSSAAVFAATPAGTEGRKWMTQDAGAVYLYLDNGSAWVEVNYLRQATSGVVTITSTTAPQLNVRYDASNHLAISVSSAGAVTLNATGASAGFAFSDAVTVSSGGNSVDATATGASSSAVIARPTHASFTGVGFHSIATRAASNAFNHVFCTSNGVTVAAINGDGSATFAAGVTVTSLTATALIHTTLTTEQLRLRYDATNYCSVTVAADGTTTFDSVDDGSTGAFVFSDPVTISGALEVTGLLTIQASASYLLQSSALLPNNSGAETATMTNGPIAGNPTKWVPIRDTAAGTTYYIPMWA